MAEKTEYYLYTNTNASHTTVGVFLRDQASIAFNIGLDPKTLLEYTGSDTDQNGKVIYDTLFSDDKQLASKYKDQLLSPSDFSAETLKNVPFPIGAKIALPFDKIDGSFGVIQSTNFIDSADYEGFMAKKLFDLLNDKSYRSDTENRATSINSVSDIFSNVSVWVWSRALSTDISTGKMEDVLLDITPFVGSLNTSVTETGGNFTFDLAPALAEFNGDWGIDLKSIKRTANNEVVLDTFFHVPDENNNLKRRCTYFKNVLSQNDVVFLRFEKLEVENDRSPIDYSFEVDKADLPNKVYDMIGLIDSVDEDFDGTSNNLSLTVTGRDLIKLFIEDGVYFYPFEFTSESMFANLNSKSGATSEQLLRFKGQIRSRFQNFQRSIDSTMKYVINALSTIQICSDTLFNAYGDKRTNAYQLTTDEKVKEDQANKDLEKNKQETYALIEKARKKDSLRKYNSVPNIEIYRHIGDFLIRVKEGGHAIEKGGKLVGWKPFKNDNEFIRKPSRLPFQLDNELYRAAYGYRSVTGKVLTSSEKDKESLEFAANVKRECAKILKEIKRLRQGIKDIPLTDEEQNYRDTLDAAANATLDGDDVNSEDRKTLDFKAAAQDMNAFHKKQLAKAREPIDQISNTAEVSGVSNVQLNEKILNSKINAIQDLEDQYDRLMRSKPSFGIVAVPENFATMPNTFAKQAIQKVWEQIKNINTVNKNRELGAVRGIWQIIKLTVDDSVANRRMSDSSIGNEHGSLLNAMNKICLKPFVEFFTDTYGDQFNLVVRKPPFDRKSIVSYLHKSVNFKADEPATQISDTNDFSAYKSIETSPESDSIVRSVKESDVISTSLSFDTTAYSWYKLDISPILPGTTKQMSQAFLKAVYFPEYAEIFGSKPMDRMTNYIPFYPVKDKNEKTPNAYFIRQGMLDLLYMIESSAYLPFTRMGTIVINGDRTIKRGNFIKLESTGEIYYVDSVSNNFTISDTNIDRTTTLQVSRGMREDYIKGITVDGVRYSYFDLCHVPYDESVFNNNNKDATNFSEMVASDWHVNKPVFNFFVKGLQCLPKEEAFKFLGGVHDNTLGRNLDAKGNDIDDLSFDRTNIYRRF